MVDTSYKISFEIQYFNQTVMKVYNVSQWMASIADSREAGCYP
ncbi:MAG: hypothetical protein ABFS16_12845 [Bacteroidota bacterium]